MCCADRHPSRLLFPSSECFVSEPRLTGALLVFVGIVQQQELIKIIVCNSTCVCFCLRNGGEESDFKAMLWAETICRSVCLSI